MIREFTVAGVQIAVRPNDVEHNVEKTVTWLRKAVSEHGAELVVFPESITTGFTLGLPLEEVYALAETVPGPVTDRVGKEARALGTYVVLPMYERGPERGVVFNSSVLIGRDGEIVGVYRKTHPFPTERIEGGGWTTPGHGAEVYETDLGRIGMIICYDGDFPELCRLLAVKGAEIITRPSAFLRSFDIWYITNCARAYDNHVYLVAVNSVGPDAGGNYYFGHSMIVSPIANRLAQARGTEEIISARLNPEPLKYVTYGARSPMVFDHLEDRNLGVVAGCLKPAKSAFEPAKRIPYRRK